METHLVGSQFVLVDVLVDEEAAQRWVRGVLVGYRVGPDGGWSGHVLWNPGDGGADVLAWVPRARIGDIPGWIPSQARRP